MVSSKRGAFSLRAARLQGEALARAVALVPEQEQVAALVLDLVLDLVLVRVPDLVAVPELEQVAALVADQVADRAVVLLQWLPAR